MKEKWEKLTAVLAEKERVSKLDMILALLAALLSGVIIGFLMCPKRKSVKLVGCLNGNGNVGGDRDCEGDLYCDEECEEENDEEGE